MKVEKYSTAYFKKLVDKEAKKLWKHKIGLYYNYENNFFFTVDCITKDRVGTFAKCTYFKEHTIGFYVNSNFELVKSIYLGMF
jgi:hypothetical protein